MDVSLDLIAQADEAYLRVDGDLLLVTVDNGCACYRVLGLAAKPDAVRCRLESFELEPAETS